MEMMFLQVQCGDEFRMNEDQVCTVIYESACFHW